MLINFFLCFVVQIFYSIGDPGMFNGWVWKFSDPPLRPALSLARNFQWCLYLSLTASCYRFRWLFWLLVFMKAPFHGKGRWYIAKKDSELSTKVELHVLSYLNFPEIRKELLGVSIRPIIFKFTLDIVTVSSCAHSVRMLILSPYLTFSQYHSVSNFYIYEGHNLVIVCVFIPTHSLDIPYHANGLYLRTPPPASASGTSAEPSQSWPGYLQTGEPGASYSSVLLFVFEVYRPSTSKPRTFSFLLSHPSSQSYSKRFTTFFNGASLLIFPGQLNTFQAVFSYQPTYTTQYHVNSHFFHHPSTTTI